MIFYFKKYFQSRREGEVGWAGFSMYVLCQHVFVFCRCVHYPVHLGLPLGVLLLYLTLLDMMYLICWFGCFAYLISLFTILKKIGTLFEVMLSAFYGPFVFLVNRVPFNVVLFHECLCELLVWFSGGSLNTENFTQ